MQIVQRVMSRISIIIRKSYYNILIYSNLRQLLIAVHDFWDKYVRNLDAKLNMMNCAHNCLLLIVYFYLFMHIYSIGSLEQMFRRNAWGTVQFSKHQRPSSVSGTTTKPSKKNIKGHLLTRARRGSITNMQLYGSAAR